MLAGALPADRSARDRLRTAGLERVRLLTWERAAKPLLGAFDEIEPEIVGTA